MQSTKALLSNFLLNLVPLKEAKHEWEKLCYLRNSKTIASKRQLMHFLRLEPSRLPYVNPAIRYTVWRYITEGLKPSPKSLPKLPRPLNDVYELQHPDD